VNNNLTSTTYISFILATLIIPIFFVFDFDLMKFHLVREFGNQSVVLYDSWYSGKLLVFPLTFVTVSILSIIFIYDSSFYYAFLKNKYLIIIFLYSIFLIVYSFIFLDIISMRNIKTLFCINYFIYLFIFFEYLFKKFYINKFLMVSFLNFIFLITILSMFFNYIFYLDEKKIFFNVFSNHQFDTYFLYIFYLSSIFNFQLVNRINSFRKNIHYLLNGFIQILPFVYIATNNNIAAYGTLIAFLSIFTFIKIFKFQKITNFIFINLIFLNIIIIFFLISQTYIYNFYGEITPLDERSRIFFRFLDGFEFKSIFGFIGHEYKLFYDGSAHNDILEVFLTLGLGAIIMYAFLFEKINNLFDSKLVYSSVIALIFVGGLSQNNLLSLYLLPMIALSLVMFKN
tara:strand:+ start:8767 stop:9963 length:1197 start_codon:yes stop_codon:yes gene_type:complete